MGWLIAFFTVEKEGFRSDKFKTRPDMKPYPAMVKIDEDEVPYKTMKEALYKSAYKNNYKASNWYRWLFPQSADFTVKENPYRTHSYREIFD
jgi:hypothetical protein